MNEYLIKSLLESMGVDEKMVEKLGGVLQKIDRLESIETKLESIENLLESLTAPIGQGK